MGLLVALPAAVRYGFLLALLVLVAVLGAPCRRSLGDAVLLPDEEDL